MQVTLRACWLALRTAWGDSRVLTAASLVVVAALSALPALQVGLISALVRALTDGQSFTAVAPLLAGVAAVACAGQPLGQIDNGIGYQLVSRARVTHQRQLAGAVSRMSPSKLRKPEVADQIQSIGDSIPFGVGYLYKFALEAAQGIVGAIGLCVAVFVINPIAGILVLLAVVPTVASLQYLIAVQERMEGPLSALRRRASYLQSLLTRPGSATELAGLGTAGRVARWIGDEHEALSVQERQLLPAILRSQLLSGLVTALLIAGALVAVVIGTDVGAAAAAGIVGALSGIGAMRAAGFAVGEIAEAAPKTKRYLDFVHSSPPTPSQKVGGRVDSVEVRGLTFSYPNVDHPAVAEVSLHASRGEMVALVGANGAGKTTTVNCIVGIFDTPPGTVIIDGQDASTIPEHQRWGKFGLLTQEFGRYEVPVADAVNLGTPDDLEPDGVWKALRTARADALVESFPDRLDTQLGDQWGGVGISGGEWQRIALARIAARNAGVWILDEPTSAVDAAAEQEIFDELAASKAERITIVVSHRAWTLRHADRIYVFENGQIVEQGPYDQLLQNDGVFARLFKQQTLSVSD